MARRPVRGLGRHPGAVTVYGRLLDGAGDPVPDGLIETWQADAAGRFAHPDDPRGPLPDGDLGFRGFGRCPTGHDGTFKIGPLPAGDGQAEAPTSTCPSSPAACSTGP